MNAVRFLAVMCCGLTSCSQALWAEDTLDDPEEQRIFVQRTTGEYQQLERELVRQWLSDAQDKELLDALTNWVCKATILRTFAPDKVKAVPVNLGSRRSLREKVAAIAREYYRREEGLEVDLRKSFRSEYVIYPGRFRD